MVGRIWRVSLLLSTGLGFGVGPASGQQMEVRFGAQGLEQLSYRGQVLEDVKRWPEDGFHIWHMKCFDAAGKALQSGQYGWGENNNGRSWDLANKTWTYNFVWGTIKVGYVQRGDALDVKVTEVNRAGSGVVLDGASVFPVALHLPGMQMGDARIGDGVEAPGVTLVDWHGGEVAVAALDAGKPLYTGFQGGKDGAYAVIASGTRPDALPVREGAAGRPVRPGETDTFTVSLRFAESGRKVEQVAGDALKSWAERWPQRLEWTDRRAIGTVFLASSGQGEKTRGAGFPMNPRRYFADAGLDARGAGGLERFQRRVLEQARTVAANLKRLDAQGAITWDIEGEEYPQDTSYVCAPDAIGRVAPEMESVVGAGKYAGMKLDDAYFKTIRDAGFKVGVCVRPQRFVLGADGTARQESVPDHEAAAELIRKMKFAHERWGATIFYLDSTVRGDGSTLPASVIEEAAAAVPDSLVIPEESSARMYRAAAPFMSFLFHGDVGTDAAVQAYYPRAFGVNLVNDVSAAKLSAHRRELVDSVRRGDVLMVHAGFWQENDATVVEMYREARGRAR